MVLVSLNSLAGVIVEDVDVRGGPHGGAGVHAEEAVQGGVWDGVVLGALPIPPAVEGDGATLTPHHKRPSTDALDSYNGSCWRDMRFGQSGNE